MYTLFVLSKAKTLSSDIPTRYLGSISNGSLYLLRISNFFLKNICLNKTRICKASLEKNENEEIRYFERTLRGVSVGDDSGFHRLSLPDEAAAAAAAAYFTFSFQKRSVCVHREWIRLDVHWDRISRSRFVAEVTFAFFVGETRSTSAEKRRKLQRAKTSWSDDLKKLSRTRLMQMGSSSTKNKTSSAHFANESQLLRH